MKINIFHIAWGARYTWYRIRHLLRGQWSSYLGKPTFHNGLDKLVVRGSLGIFPHWRIEFHGCGKLYTIGRVRIGHNFHAVVGGDLVIEDGVVIGPNVYISTYETILLENMQPVKERNVRQMPISIKKHAFIGMGSIIFPGVTIGEYAVVGAYSIVKKDVLMGAVFRNE